MIMVCLLIDFVCFIILFDFCNEYLEGLCFFYEYNVVDSIFVVYMLDMYIEVMDLLFVVCVMDSGFWMGLFINVNVLEFLLIFLVYISLELLFL